ncbi:MAG: hypothetical protein ACQEXQ_02810 [Bacillota bacterium]
MAARNTPPNRPMVPDAASVKQSYSCTNGPRFTKYWCRFTAKIGENNLFDLLKAPFCITRIISSEYSNVTSAPHQFNDRNTL